MPISSSSASLLLCPESPDDMASWDSDHWAPLPLSAGSSHISLLLAAEAELMPLPESLSENLLLPRQNAVNWILNVNEFYRFTPVTAFLAVNYLDRFLSSNTLPGQNGGNGGWPMQLLSVACLSVAAKMEETHVPLLLDLQVLDAKFVFESKTIRRMELVLMSALKWRMRSITPFDFIDYFGDSIKSELIAGSRAGLVSRSADLILRTCREIKILGYRPSEIAAAAIIRAAKEIADVSSGRWTELLKCFSEWVNEEIVRACLQLIDDFLIDTCPSSDAPEPRTPQSPVGVIDAAACRSCDSQKSSVGVGLIEPPTKRRRLHEILCTENIDENKKH